MIGERPVADRRLRWRLACTLLLTAFASSCTVRPGIVRAGSLPPDGVQLGQAFVAKIQAARRAWPLPPLPRDPDLDQLAQRAVEILAAGLPENVAAVDHLVKVAKLPPELTYAVDFEPRTPGVDERTRAAGAQQGGISLDEALLAGDPALDRFGWAASGPWYVAVLRARPLHPSDAPALQRTIELGLRAERPALLPDPKLARLAAQALADGEVGRDDVTMFGQAGGVPAHVQGHLDGVGLVSVGLAGKLTSERQLLGDSWLAGVGVATRIDDAGNVAFLALATGEADRAALAKQLEDAQPKATELVNRARAEAALPPVTLDATLVESARRWVAEAAIRGCFVGSEDDPGCPGAGPQGAGRWYANHGTWSGPDAASTWQLAPAIYGDELLTRFGAAATLAPDGTVWVTLVLAR